MDAIIFEGVIGMPQKAKPKEIGRFVTWVKGPGQLVLMMGGLIVSLIGGVWVLAGKQSATTYEIIMAKNEFAAAKVEISTFRSDISTTMKMMLDGEARRNLMAEQNRNAVIESLRYMLLLRERARNSQIERIIRELEQKQNGGEMIAPGVPPR